MAFAEHMSKQKTTNQEEIAMKNFKMIAKNFVNDESGQDLIEYALVAAVISLGAVATLKPLASEIGTVFSSVTTTLSASV
jgi:pilus assembly protein Flp/PilA